MAAGAATCACTRRLGHTDKMKSHQFFFLDLASVRAGALGTTPHVLGSRWLLGFAVHAVTAE